MKILMIIQFFTPQRGGSVNNVYNLTKHLTLKGHAVTIFSSDSKYDAKIADSLRPAIVVPFRSYLGSFYYSPGMKMSLDEEIANYDVVHLNNYWSYQNIIANQVAMKYNVPIVLSPHGSLPIMMRGYGRKFLFNHFFGKKILKNAAKIIAVSDMEYRQVVSKNVKPEKIMIIPGRVMKKC
jgi:glycosyltransferase involved in cell wall biosynthesis